jgi:hypothetical protein
MAHIKCNLSKSSTIFISQGVAEEDYVKKDKKKKKKHKKEKKHKKDKQEEEKILNMDQQSNTKPGSEAWKDIPTPAWSLQPRETRNLSPRESRNLSPAKRSSPEPVSASLFLQRRLTPQNDLSDDSDDSEDNARVKGPESYNILSTPRSPRQSKFQVSDSDSDVPRRHRVKKSKLRVESSTEDERQHSKKRIFKRRNRQLSESD